MFSDEYYNFISWLPKVHSKMNMEYGLASAFLSPEGETNGEYYVYELPERPELKDDGMYDDLDKEIWKTQD